MSFLNPIEKLIICCSFSSLRYLSCWGIFKYYKVSLINRSIIVPHPRTHTHLSIYLSIYLIHYGAHFKTVWLPFYYYRLTLIPASISNYSHDQLWDKITYPFPNFNGATVEVWEWISNSTHFLLGMQDLSSLMLVKGAPGLKILNS